jgi:hypothetical protein
MKLVKPLAAAPKAFAALAAKLNEFIAARPPLVAGAGIRLAESSQRAIISADFSSIGPSILSSNFFPFFAVANENTLSVASGLVLSPFVGNPTLVVASASGDPSDTHAWLKVEWSGTTLSTADIEFGTAWPSPLYSAASSYANIPLAYISGGELRRLCTTNLTLHRVFVSGGVIFWPLHK